jgi:hypothetical protein
MRILPLRALIESHVASCAVYLREVYKVRQSVSSAVLILLFNRKCIEGNYLHL